jgi:hypothetical protein
MRAFDNAFSIRKSITVYMYIHVLMLVIWNIMVIFVRCSAVVRKALYEVAGEWAISLKDRSVFGLEFLHIMTV